MNFKNILAVISLIILCVFLDGVIKALDYDDGCVPCEMINFSESELFNITIANSRVMIKAYDCMRLMNLTVDNKTVYINDSNPLYVCDIPAITLLSMQNQ